MSACLLRAGFDLSSGSCGSWGDSGRASDAFTIRENYATVGSTNGFGGSYAFSGSYAEGLYASGSFHYRRATSSMFGVQ